MNATSATVLFAPSASRQRWLMLGLVWMLYVCFGITTSSIPPLVDPILADLGISNSQMGMVLGAWPLVFIGTASPMGWLVDRLGVRKALGIGIIVVLASLVLRGLATNFITLFLAVGLFGIGGPVISIGAPKMVAQWFGGKERGLATGIYLTGPTVGSTFALATASSVVVPFIGSWRGISVVYGTGVALAAIAWWLFAKEIPATKQAAIQGRQQANDGDGPRLLSLRNVQLLMVMAMATFFVGHGLNDWIPTLLKESGMTLVQAGAWTASSTALGALGLLLVPNHVRRGRRTMALGLLLALASATTVGLALGHGPMLLVSLMMSSTVRSPITALLTLVLMETPGVGTVRMGLAGGLLFTAAEVGGFSGPFLQGFLRDATGSLVAGVLALAVVSATLLLLLPFIKERGQGDG
ncbi:MAG: MFS transporter [Dehalococcoidia bacterium]|nr:MFS transporter [Dehalococcoidia bacterium]